MDIVSVVIDRTPRIASVVINQGIPGLNLAIKMIATWGSPQVVSSSLNLTGKTARTQIFVVSSGGIVLNHTIPNGDLGDELWIVGTDNNDSIQLSTGGNLILSGTWRSRRGSTLYLKGIGNLLWLEGDRNEI